MNKEKKVINSQLTKSQVSDRILPFINEKAPTIHTITFTHPVQIENLLPIPISVKLRMPVLRLLSRFISKNIIYGDYTKDLKTLINSEINMYTSNELVIPVLGESFAEDIHPFNGILLSLSMSDYEKSDFHEVMDQGFKDSLRNYLKLANKTGDSSSLLSSSAISEDFMNQFSKPYIFNKIFQFFSETQNEQLNVCLETVFYKGNLKLTFFSQYWFLNEASFPLMVRFKEGSYTYDPICLGSSNIKTENDENSIGNQSMKESSIYWRLEENKINESRSSSHYDQVSVGLKSIQKNKRIEERLIHKDNLDSSFFSLKSSQLSKTYVDHLLKTKSKYLKLVTTNLVDNTETLMDVAIEDLTEWSNNLTLSNFSGNQPTLEMTEKTFEKEKLKENYKNIQEQDKMVPINQFELCLNVVQLPGKLNRTKLVLMAPKYIIVNSTKFSLLVSQIPTNKHATGQIPSNHAMSFHWNFKDKARELYLRADKKNYLWSPAFKVEKSTSFAFRMRSLDEQEMQIFSVNVNF